jgi:diguanylate cyclase (GGDEF)-like protein/PAS domain S-box-containing protein
MSSIHHSMAMGMPTNRRPRLTAPALSFALLGLGFALSSSRHHLLQVLGCLLACTGGALFWRCLRRDAEHITRLESVESNWRMLMSSSQDAIIVLRRRHDLMGRFMGWEVHQANSHAHRLFGANQGTLIGHTMDMLPVSLHDSFHHRLQLAHESRQPQIDEHALPQSDTQDTAVWLHHQIIPVDAGLILITRDTTDIHASASALQDSESFYRTLIDCLPVAVFARGARPGNAGRYVVWNKAAADVMSMPAEQVLGRTAQELLAPHVAERGDAQERLVMTDPRIHHFPGLDIPTPSGTRVVDMIKVPVFGANGQIDHILSIAQDVTAQREAAEQLRLASRVIDETGDAVVVSDAVDRIVMVNPAFLNTTGLTPTEVIGKSAELLGLPPLRESHLPGVSQALQTGQRWSGESHQVCQDGRTLDTWLSVSTLRNEAQRVTQHIRVFSDISVLKAQQRELAEQARHDSLTGLPNRRAFGERLHQAMARARRQTQALAVLYVDLDGFKAINDRYGHATGDALLVEVARRLSDSVRLTDCVCRLSGDEFTVILEGVGHPHEVRHICERILERLNQPHWMMGDSVIVSPSIGAALYEHGETADAVCQRADSAMYTAKRAGKAGYVLATWEGPRSAEPLQAQG